MQTTNVASGPPTEGLATVLTTEHEESSNTSLTTASHTHNEKDRDEDLPQKEGSAQVEQEEAPATGAIPVPRAQRRGLWANLSIIPEVEEPSKYSAGKKWAMTIIVALAAATSSTGSAIFYRGSSSASQSLKRTVLTFFAAALRPVADDLHTSQTVINLSLAFYL